MIVTINRASLAFRHPKLAAFILLLALFISTDLVGQQLNRSDSSFASIFSNSARQQPFQPLAIEVAFPFIVSRDGKDRVSIQWNPAEQHYLYKHRFQVLINTAEAQALSLKLPEGKAKHDEFFGDIEAYYDSVEMSFTLPTSRPLETVLTLEFQGCADWGFCYPPQSVKYPL